MAAGGLEPRTQSRRRYHHWPCIGAQHGAAARAEPAAHRAKPAAAACVGQPFDAAHFATQLAARGAHRAWAALWSGSAMRSPHIALVSTYEA